jgi:hypothetical protein
LLPSVIFPQLLLSAQPYFTFGLSVVWCGIVVSCVVCLVHCGYSAFFAFPWQKLFIEKRRKQKEGEKKTFVKM